MRTIIAGAFMTLDGVVQDPDGSGETEHGGWARRLFNDEAPEQAVVETNTLRGPLPWNATAQGGDPAPPVAELQGTILIYGSFTLVRTLLGHKLIEEFHIGVDPLFLGSGKRLFDGGAPGELRLVAPRRADRVSSRSPTRLSVGRDRPLKERFDQP